MATFRKLRGRWQAQVRRKGAPPKAKSFDSKADAEKWARSMESAYDQCGSLPDSKMAETMTLGDLMTRYRDTISPTKRSGASEVLRINAFLRHDICYRTMAMLSSNDLARYRDKRLSTVGPATVVRERAGSGNLHSWDKWIFCLNAGHIGREQE